MNNSTLTLVGERDFYHDKADTLWQILVMLKRELDKHDSRPGFLQLPASAWDEAVERARKYAPAPPPLPDLHT